MMQKRATFSCFDPRGRIRWQGRPNIRRCNVTDRKSKRIIALPAIQLGRMKREHPWKTISLFIACTYKPIWRRLDEDELLFFFPTKRVFMGWLGRRISSSLLIDFSDGRISVLFTVCAERRNKLQTSANPIRNGLMEVEGKVRREGLTNLMGRKARTGIRPEKISRWG